MKREILFRGFCPSKNGKQIITLDGEDIRGDWVFGDLIHNIDCVKVRERETDINRIAKSYEVIPDTVCEYIKSLPNGDKAFSNSRFEIISNVKGEDGGSGKRTDTAIIRFNDKQTEWELKVFHNGKYKRIARAGYFLNSNETKVIGTIFDKEEV